jgi:16S rRNA (cytosine1402-N4)-methyltransferase
MGQSFYHESVLLQECIENLNIKPDGIYIDATMGGAGHAKEILKHLGPKGMLICFDQDKDAIQNVPDDKRVLFINENFKYLQRFLKLYHIPPVQGILADLGVSSYQFDTASRGFSIRFDAMLDMRMDGRNTFTAKELLNTYSEPQLHKLFEQYGEVTNSKTLARTIVTKRKGTQLHSIADFKHMIQDCVKGNAPKYLAQVFQAIRIEVNQELEVLRDFCNQSIAALAPEGRLCIISFHSLEDRIVKQCMQERPVNEHQFSPIVPMAVAKQLKIISSKPITASQEELTHNTRSRSAKLRVAQKI